MINIGDCNDSYLLLDGSEVVNTGNHREIVMTFFSCLTIRQWLRQDICILIDHNNNNNNNNNPISIEMVMHSFDDH